MSIEDYWKKEAQNIEWSKPFTKVKNTSFKMPVQIKWFEDGELNACYNCLDRHLPQHADRVAYYFEPDDPSGQSASFTYQEVYDEVCRMANVLKKLGVKKGDRVTIYLPMIPEAAFAMLACARLGAVHTAVFGGFSPESLKNRIEDCESKFVITADEGLRGGKRVPLKGNLDKAIENEKDIKTLIIKHTGGDISLRSQNDYLYEEERLTVQAECPAEPVNAEHPLFILYTSGSTSKPKGILHTTGGYMVYATTTFKTVFNYQPSDIFWCTADIGWITGHSYVVYGPLSCAATSVIFEGIPSYPDNSRFWNVVDKYKVSTFYTAPTAIRALMRTGDEWVKKTDRSSLRLLGSVGEPINPEVWKWYHQVVGNGRCDIVDTWWQTETGGIMISAIPNETVLKPGSATFPLKGIELELLTTEGQVIQGAGEGLLVIKDSWPGQARDIYNDTKRFNETYFSSYPNYYFTGDGCRRDEEGYYWITGRVDDVINVSGHRLGTAELESAIVATEFVSEAAVVGFPHDIKGQGIYAYVTLDEKTEPHDDLKKKIIAMVVDKVGPIAKPDAIQWAPHLPKTRSGKIMRRILRKIAEGNVSDLGDTSTLADPSVVEELIEESKKLK